MSADTAIKYCSHKDTRIPNGLKQQEAAGKQVWTGMISLELQGQRKTDCHDQYQNRTEQDNYRYGIIGADRHFLHKISVRKDNKTARMGRKLFFKI